VPVEPVLTLNDLAPTADELAWLDHRRKARLPLQAATIEVPGAFEETPAGGREGLDWDMVKGFAHVVELPLEVKVSSNLKLFFSKGGVLPDLETDGSLDYTPDLLRQVDLYIGPFALLPWRERLMTMVPLYPMQNFLAGRKGEEVRSLVRLSGKRVAVIREAMQENLLRTLVEQKRLNIKFVYVNPQDLLDAVIEGRADYTLDGQLFFAQNRQRMSELTLSPFETDPVRVGWAMKKGDLALASLVRKYFAKSQENGTFEKFFEADFGTSFSDYMNVLATAIPAGEHR
jgi:membrane-bound lytic murein transglycosylase MltF